MPYRIAQIAQSTPHAKDPEMESQKKKKRRRRMKTCIYHRGQGCRRHMAGFPEVDHFKDSAPATRISRTARNSPLFFLGARNKHIAVNKSKRQRQKGSNENRSPLPLSCQICQSSSVSCVLIRSQVTSGWLLISSVQ